MFQQPRTLRGTVFQCRPSFSQPSRYTALLAFGSTAHGATPSRSSMRAYHGAMSSTPAFFTPNCCAQNASVSCGVRMLVVQFTTVERSEEHTSELQSLMRISYAVFCLKKKTKHNT